MAYHRIRFAPTDDSQGPRLGGLPLLPDPGSWPRTPAGKPMLLLASITGAFLAAEFPDLAVPEGQCLSVFHAFDPGDFGVLRRLRIHSQSDAAKARSGEAKVLLHQRAAKPCDPPPGAPAPIPMQSLSLEPVPAGDDDADPDDVGDMLSKVGGIPGWGQDPIALDGMEYAFQIRERDLGKGNHPHAGMFQDGVGFVFLARPLQAGETGAFFIQYT